MGLRRRDPANKRGRGAKRSGDRTGTPADLVVVGLANPGEQYQGTRHNAGAEVIELLAERHGEKLKAGREGAWVAEWKRPGPDGPKLIALAVPRTFMNLSGEAVRPLVRRYGVTDLSRLVIVHDELDLEPGAIRIKVGGGLAGHNGLKSIRDHLKTADFTRVRVGVGRPTSDRVSTADHVLRRPGKADRVEIDIAVQFAADAVEAMVDQDLEAVMNEFNRRDRG